MRPQSWNSPHRDGLRSALGGAAALKTSLAGIRSAVTRLSPQKGFPVDDADDELSRSVQAALDAFDDRLLGLERSVGDLLDPSEFARSRPTHAIVMPIHDPDVCEFASKLQQDLSSQGFQATATPRRPLKDFRVALLVLRLTCAAEVQLAREALHEATDYMSGMSPFIADFEGPHRVAGIPSVRVCNTDGSEALSKIQDNIKKKCELAGLPCALPRSSCLAGRCVPPKFKLPLHKLQRGYSCPPFLGGQMHQASLSAHFFIGTPAQGTARSFCGDSEAPESERAPTPLDDWYDSRVAWQSVGHSRWRRASTPRAATGTPRDAVFTIPDPPGDRCSTGGTPSEASSTCSPLATPLATPRTHHVDNYGSGDAHHAEKVVSGFVFELFSAAGGECPTTLNCAQLGMSPRAAIKSFGIGHMPVRLGTQHCHRIALLRIPQDNPSPTYADNGTIRVDEAILGESRETAVAQPPTTTSPAAAYLPRNRTSLRTEWWTTQKKPIVQTFYPPVNPQRLRAAWRAAGS